MGWDIDLVDDVFGEAVLLDEPQTEGSIIAIGGRHEASMCLTYNYSQFYYKHLDEEDGLRWLNGKRAGDTVERLQSAIKSLGTNRSHDYWESTPGNAGHGLSVLLSWALQYPDARWEVH